MGIAWGSLSSEQQRDEETRFYNLPAIRPNAGYAGWMNQKAAATSPGIVVGNRGTTGQLAGYRRPAVVVTPDAVVEEPGQAPELPYTGTHDVPLPPPKRPAENWFWSRVPGYQGDIQRGGFGSMPGLTLPSLGGLVPDLTAPLDKGMNMLTMMLMMSLLKDN